MNLYIFVQHTFVIFSHSVFLTSLVVFTFKFSAMLSSFACFCTFFFINSGYKVHTYKRASRKLRKIQFHLIGSLVELKMVNLTTLCGWIQQKCKDFLSKIYFFSLNYIFLVDTLYNENQIKTIISHRMFSSCLFANNLRLWKFSTQQNMT